MDKTRDDNIGSSAVNIEKKKKKKLVKMMAGTNMFTLQASLIILSILHVSVFVQYSVASAAAASEMPQPLLPPQRSLRKVLKETEPLLFNAIADSSGLYVMTKYT